MVFCGEGLLRHAVSEYVEHNHHDRPHYYGIGNIIRSRSSGRVERSERLPRDGPISCRDRLEGLLCLDRRKEGA